MWVLFNVKTNLRTENYVHVQHTILLDPIIYNEFHGKIHSKSKLIPLVFQQLG